MKGMSLGFCNAKNVLKKQQQMFVDQLHFY